MKIIDIHTHVFPDAIAEKTMAFLSEKAGVKPFLNGTVADLKRSMDAAGIAVSVNQPIATTPSQVVSINNWALGIQDERIVSFGSLHPQFEGIDEELGRIKGLGIRGVKLHPDYQRFHPDEEAVFPLYEALIRHDMIALFHAGVDIGLYPPMYGTPQRIARVLDIFPAMTIVAAHLGGYDCWDEVEQYLVGKRVFLDTSYVIDHMEQAWLVRIMREHGFDRILFATDSPWKRQDEEVRKIAALPIPERAKEDVLSGNAGRLLQR